MYFVLFQDDFGDKHIARYDNYQAAHNFWRTPSNVVFPLAPPLSADDLWAFVTTNKNIYNIK